MSKPDKHVYFNGEPIGEAATWAEADKLARRAGAAFAFDAPRFEGRGGFYYGAGTPPKKLKMPAGGNDAA